jgi:putative transposase
MQFEPNHMYHIFNRGNNAQKIFFNNENYLFFLKKVRLYICPYADILAWCLMPNHFHLMVYVNQTGITLSEQVSENRKEKVPESVSEQVTESHQLTRERTLNDSISIMLRSYTRAIHNQERISGSLFQHRTKALCLTEISGVTPAWFETTFGTVINIPDSEKEYPQVCFNYIHQNPVTAQLVKNPCDWEYSSYRDFAGIRNGSLISRERVKEFGLHI